MKPFLKQSLAGLRVLLVLTVVLGLAYPAAVWAFGQVAARDQAAGSLVRQGDRVIGSSLLGQRWEGPQWFHSRPAVGNYAGGVSGGSNLGPGPALDTAVRTRAQTAGLDPRTAPADALTTSASGLDPHISPAYAHTQVQRVATARGVDVAVVAALVTAHTQGRTLGFLGEPRVDVLGLNLALRRAAPSVAR